MGFLPDLAGDVLWLRNFIILFFMMTVCTDTLHAADQMTCGYRDYYYIPHPDYESDSTSPKKLTLRVKRNADYAAFQGGVRDYYYVDSINPDNGEILETIRMSLTCNALGVIHCELYTNDKPPLDPSTAIEIGILKNFASGSMKDRTTFALSMPGLTVATKNSHVDDDFVKLLRRSNSPAFNLLPDLWVSDKKMNDCNSEKK